MGCRGHRVIGAIFGPVKLVRDSPAFALRRACVRLIKPMVPARVYARRSSDSWPRRPTPISFSSRQQPWISQHS